MTNELDIVWMQRALELARHAEQAGEVPVGAVLVLNQEIIGEGYNSPISQHDPSGHAEIIALRHGANTINNYRLINSTLYVTLEPCLMCAGAMVHARIKRLVYGASDLKTGAIVTQMRALELPFLNHRVDFTGGVLKEECGDILSKFFQARR